MLLASLLGLEEYPCIEENDGRERDYIALYECMYLVGGQLGSPSYLSVDRISQRKRAMARREREAFCFYWIDWLRCNLHDIAAYSSIDR